MICTCCINIVFELTIFFAAVKMIVMTIFIYHIFYTKYMLYHIYIYNYILCFHIRQVAYNEYTSTGSMYMCDAYSQSIKLYRYVYNINYIYNCIDLCAIELLGPSIIIIIPPQHFETYYRRVSSRGRRVQICFSRGACCEKPENDCPPFWFYR